jgi:hypothetical protein
MDLTEYIGLHGSEMATWELNYVTGLVSGSDWGRHIRGGVLPFTPETASSWGGPFPGDFAAFRLTDHRETPSLSGHRPKARKRTGLEPPPKLVTQVGDEHQARYPGQAQEMVTTARPFELRVYGNDDTSYTKFYASEEEALQELELFEGGGPLDFHEFVEGFGFTFTN